MDFACTTANKSSGAKIGVARINGSHVPPKGEGTQRRKIKGKVEEEEHKPKEVVLLRLRMASKAPPPLMELQDTRVEQSPITLFSFSSMPRAAIALLGHYLTDCRSQNKIKLIVYIIASKSFLWIIKLKRSFLSDLIRPPRLGLPSSCFGPVREHINPGKLPAGPANMGTVLGNTVLCCDRRTRPCRGTTVI